MRKLLHGMCAGMLACCMFAVGALGAGVPSAQSVLVSEKTAYGIAGGSLMQGAFLEQKGTAAADWVAFAAARAGADDTYAAYRAALEQYIRTQYQTADKLGKNVTEWHRVSLTLLACGGNPRQTGGVDLIADGTYYRGRTLPLGRQGINGYIWALITLDSMGYAVPGGASDTRESILKGILSRQLAGGGFAGAGSAADADLTAMAVTALAPYYHADTAYTFTNSKTKQTVTTTVRAVVDKALTALSGLQTADGGFRSGGQPSSESASQVIVALCSMGINPESDTRFLKNGKSPLDALLTFRAADGGFRSRPGDASSNRLANGQAMLALNALERLGGGERALFDLRPAFSRAQKQKLSALRERIRQAGQSPGTAEIEAIHKAYLALPENERRYVYNYTDLAIDTAGRQDSPGILSGNGKDTGASREHGAENSSQTEAWGNETAQTDTLVSAAQSDTSPSETAAETHDRKTGVIVVSVLLCAIAAGGGGYAYFRFRVKKR